MFGAFSVGELSTEVFLAFLRVWDVFGPEGNLLGMALVILAHSCACPCASALGVLDVDLDENCIVDDVDVEDVAKEN